MANSPQARKRNRQNARRSAVCRSRKSRINTFVNGVDRAIQSGDRDAADTAFRAAESEIMRGASRGVLHRNTASRKVSRLARRVLKM